MPVGQLIFPYSFRNRAAFLNPITRRLVQHVLNLLPLTMDHRREIDGLRALAVLPVMLFHAGYEVFGGGFVGVDIFFVISGYLML